jgi:hypothetical protein
MFRYAKVVIEGDERAGDERAGDERAGDERAGSDLAGGWAEDNVV